MWPGTRRILSRRRANSVCVLAELNAFVHCSNEVCFAQELPHDVLLRSTSDSKCDACTGTFCTSPILPSGGAASRSFTSQVTSVFCGFRSTQTLALATSNSCRNIGTKIGWHRMSTSSTYHRSARPPFFCNVCRGS